MVQPVCRTCDILLLLLGDAKKKVGVTISRMRMFTGAARPDDFQAALLEARSVRKECQAIRAEVERHKGQHRRIIDAGLNN